MMNENTINAHEKIGLGRAEEGQEEAVEDVDTNSNSQEQVVVSPYQHLDLKQYNTCQTQIGLTDEDLKTIGTKDLNKKVKHSKNLSEEDIEKIKKRRRTIKNRGYAKECRNTKTEEEKLLEAEKKELNSQIKEGEQQTKAMIDQITELQERN